MRVFVDFGSVHSKLHTLLVLVVKLLPGDTQARRQSLECGARRWRCALSKPKQSFTSLLCVACCFQRRIWAFTSFHKSPFLPGAFVLVCCIYLWCNKSLLRKVQTVAMFCPFSLFVGVVWKWQRDVNSISTVISWAPSPALGHVCRFGSWFGYSSIVTRTCSFFEYM